jgi:hypothetical protein
VPPYLILVTDNCRLLALHHATTASTNSHLMTLPAQGCDVYVKYQKKIS